MFYRKLAEDFLMYMIQHTKPPFDEPTQYSRGKFGILIYLHAIRDGATSGELSQHFSVSTGRIATALKTMEKEGMLLRKSDDTDKRRVTVHITDKGRSFLNERHQEAIAKTAEKLSQLEQDEAVELIRLVKKIMKD